MLKEFSVQGAMWSMHHFVDLVGFFVCWFVGFLFFFFLSFFKPFLGPIPWHMEIPRLGVESEL